jgi:hypothetical protein
MHGVRGALLCGGALMLLAGLVAWFGLWGFKLPVHAEKPITVEA